VNSERVVGVYDWGEERDVAGRWMSFIVMELIDGEPVSALLARKHTLSPAHVAALIEDTATALLHAHRRGVVHRDIKPANLLIGPDGRIKVADFGIARATDATRLTATGTLLGTATYLSPEQVQGHPTTPASDIFSLGVVAYQCLAGSPPFVAAGEIATALARLGHPAPPLPATVPRPIADLVTGMLAEDPEQRPTAEHVVETAHGIAATELGAAATVVMPTALMPTVAMPVPMRAPDRTTRFPLPAQREHRDIRRPAIVLATIAGLFLLAGGLALSGAFGHSDINAALASHAPSPRATAPSTSSQPTTPAQPTVGKTHPTTLPATPPKHAPKHGPGHVPPGHANGHGPKKNKHGHGPGPGAGAGPGH
jgi:serine/threonine-protein kinase